MDLTVALFTDSTFMPDTQLSIVKRDDTEEDKDTVDKILEDLRREMKGNVGADNGSEKKTFVNSFVTEIKINNPPEDFKLNLFMKPFIDIVSRLGMIIDIY